MQQIENQRKRKKEKRDKYSDLARELKKLWNMKITVIPFVIDALGRLSIRKIGVRI